MNDVINLIKDLKTIIPYILFWLFTAVLSSAVKGQSYLKAYHDLSVAQSGIDSLQVDSLMQQAIKANQFYQVAEIASKEADQAFRNKNYNRALSLYQIAWEQYDQSKHSDSKAQMQFQLGLSHYRLKQYSESIDQFQGLIRKDVPDSLQNLALYEIGKSFYWQGEFYKAEAYYKQHIDGLRQTNDKHDLINKYFALIRVYNEILTPNSQTKLKTVLDQIGQLKDEVAFSPIQKLAFNNYYANYYNHPATYNFEKAKEYYEKNLALAEQTNQSRFLCATWNNLADLYNEAKRDGALNYLQNSLENCLGPSAYYTYHHTSFAYLNQLNFDLALEYIEKSIDALVPNKSGDATLDFVNTPNKINYLLAMERKAEIYIKRHQVSGDRADLESALEVLKQIDAWIDIIESGAFEQRSQLHWRAAASIAYTRAIYCAGALDRHDEVFYFNEKSKALLLTDAILRNGIRPEIPTALSLRENQLRAIILELQRTQDQQELNPEQSKTLFDTQRKLEQISDSIAALYPAYIAQNSKARLMDLQTVIQDISPDEIVLSYNWQSSAENDNFIHLLAIHQQGSSYHKIALTEAVTQLLEEHQRSLRQPWVRKEDQTTYHSQASQLFDLLFPAPIQPLLVGKRIIVIPDGPLQYLAFEPLINPNTQRFLVEDHPISYAYSMSFLKHSATQQRAPVHSFSGFAPVEFGRIQQDSLPHTFSEVQKGQDLLAGEIFTRSLATKDNFTTYGHQSRIIHLATHAKASGAPWIAFHDADLELHELYTSKVQADLVVLSGCETSIGEIATGEGTMSLTRGFLYAGSNAVLSSLWNVNDKSTAWLMNEFYQGVSDGMDTAAALQAAKVNYLANHSLSERAPYYWGSFVLIGNTNALEIPSRRNPWWQWLLLSGGLLWLLVHFFRKKVKKVG